MRYIDSSVREPSQAVGTWLQQELQDSVTELRWQSGFFSSDGLRPFIPTLQRLSAADQPIYALIGSNEGGTLRADVTELAALLGLPRGGAQLGVINYAGAYYHPKTYHLKRADGSQAAYVGSANLTLPGIASLNIEAGVLLDEQHGDDVAVLTAIAESVDNWFTEAREGFEQVLNGQDIVRLVQTGVLAETPPPRAPGTGDGSGAGAGGRRPRLQPLIRFPAPRGAAAGAVAPGPVLLPVVSRPPYPEYVYFAPGATTATSGITALSGTVLPGGYVGLIIQLNQDSARHWSGAPGTANISLPIQTVPTLRFGMYQGRRDQRPRAELGLEMRYMYSGGELRASSATTNVMIYGFGQDVGHQDRRMGIPRAQSREIQHLVEQQRLPVPKSGDVAFLEWPTMANPSFRLTLLDPTLALAQQATATLNAATAAHEVIGRGACWLPPNIVPRW